MSNQYDDLLTAMNDGTNAVAARLDKLTAQIAADAAAALAAGQVPPPPTAEQMAEFKAIADHLKAMGADPANPVPAAPGA